VPDGADLKHIMSAYYEYFAHGQEMCSGSWVKYQDIGSGSTLYASCMAMYDRTVPTPELLGVSCMDANLFADIKSMQDSAGWNFFKCVASDMTKMCRQVDLSDCHRQKIRQSYSQDSVCEAKYSDYVDVLAETVCPCTEQGCVDTVGWTDEKDYFCDTWVGDDCSKPNPAWGYSSAGMAEVRQNCKRSCGLCPWSSGTCGRSDAMECPITPIPTECRACLGVVSGVDIDGKDMACPADAPRDLMSTTTTPCPTDSKGNCLTVSAASHSSPLLAVAASVAAFSMAAFGVNSATMA